MTDPIYPADLKFFTYVQSDLAISEKKSQTVKLLLSDQLRDHQKAVAEEKGRLMQQ